MVDEARESVSKQSQLRLSRWLRGELGVVGSLDCVREYGAQQILDVLHERILEWDRAKSAWRPRRQVKNPAGLLRWVLDEERRSA